MVEDQGWFFDTELLVLAEHNGLRIHEVPVDWVDDPDSRVDVVSTAKADLQGIWRMVRRIAAGNITVAPTSLPEYRHRDVDTSAGAQLVRFASIGAVSTVVFAVLFALLSGPLGVFVADVVALGVCAIANTAANRRLTFALRGRIDRGRHYATALTVALIPLFMTLSMLGFLGAVGWGSLPIELVTLTATNGVAALVRFTALRRWVFRSPTATEGRG
jgi:putative flippase GtrA